MAIFIQRCRAQYAAVTLTTAFARFNLALILAALAGETFRLCFVWKMLKQASDAATFGIAMAVMGFFQIAFRLCVGWLGDRYGPLRVVMCTFLIQAIVAGTLSVMMIEGHDSPIAVIALLGAFGACMGARDPVSLAAVASLVPTHWVTKAMGLRGAVSSATSVIGPVFAGIALAVLGADGGVLSSASLLFLTGLFLMGVGNGADTRLSGETLSSAAFISTWVQQTVGSLRIFVRLRADFYLCLVTCAVNFVLPALFSIVIPFLVIHVYRLPPSLIGLFDFFFALGMVVGGCLVVGWTNRTFGKRNAIGIGLASTAIPHFFLALSSNVVLSSVGMFLAGLGMLNLFTNGSGLRATATPPEFRSRVFSAASFLVAVSIAPGMWVISALLPVLGPHVLLLCTGTATVCAAALVYAVPDLQTLMKLSEDDSAGAYARLYPAAFQTPRA
ncbi:MFS transporter [Verminephrobacter aporrectodeae]|uniref:MFS transporter n=1 Tax=Verminephrobacter aporrectodeae TaxID=1110389 RepID=UPI002244343B|nr:MFS transporter [Verminephrobacter aporrectodeae]